MSDKKRFLIKVCGVRDEENIRQLLALDIDMIGFVFCTDSPRYVQMISSMAGIIPDYSRDRYQKQCGTLTETDDMNRIKRVGVFSDDMPQNIITRIYNYNLDEVQLDGAESPVMIDNLRRSVDPDIRAGIKIIKTISVASVADLEQCKAYEGYADLLRFTAKCEDYDSEENKFDWSLLNAYEGKLPFLLSGNIGLEDAERVRTFQHPMCIGIEVNSRFETAPGMKDVNLLKRFIAEVRR